MKPEQILKLREQLLTQRNMMQPHWEELARIYMPFALGSDGQPDIPSADSMHDATPRDCALVMANGLASLITPREEEFFMYRPPIELKDDKEAVSWYRECTETARAYLEASNGFEELQEGYINSPVFGTSALFCGDIDEESGQIHYKELPVGSFLIIEDSKGNVVGLLRDLKFTADQAVEEYSKENLPREIQNAAGKAKGATELYEFVNYVCKRPSLTNEDKANKPDSEQTAFVSYVVSVKGKSMVDDKKGYHEFPFSVHRYRKFGNCPWGFGPGFNAKGDSRQLSFLTDLADVGTEKAIFPPVKAPAALEGEVSQGPLEITYYEDTDPNRGGGLDTWGAPQWQSIKAARDAIADKREQVRLAFHTDMFNFFMRRAMEKGPITAYEANQIVGEKMANFSPVYGRLISERLSPLLSRLFGVLYRANKFSEPPATVTAAIGGKKAVAFPRIGYKNKIALAIEMNRNGSLVSFMQIAAPIIEADPTVLDQLDTGTAFKEVAQNAGLPEKWFRKQAEVDEIKKQRAQNAADAQDLAKADAATNIAANATKAGINPATAQQQQ